MTAKIDPASPWFDEGWFPEVQAWIRATLARSGITITGSLSQPHVRMWSTALHISTDQGAYFFKATTQSLRYEARLTRYLSERYPTLVAELLAVDEDHGWLLMPAGGQKLRQYLQSTRDHALWQRILRGYASLQVSLTEFPAEILALGTPDRGLGRFPTLYHEILRDPDALGVGTSWGLSRAEYRKLLKLQGLVSRLCHELDDCGIPASLDHGDLHDNNIFLANSEFRIFDWGDSSLTHPFFSLRTAFVNMEMTFGWAEGAPIFDKFAEEYLDSWRIYTVRDDLQKAFSLAQRLWSLSSAYRWYIFQDQFPGEHQGEYQAAVPALLKEFLGANQTRSIISPDQT